MPKKLSLKELKGFIVNSSDENKVERRRPVLPEDSETLTKVFKTINYGGDICIIDEFFILSRMKAFEVYNLDGDLLIKSKKLLKRSLVWIHTVLKYAIIN